MKLKSIFSIFIMLIIILFLVNFVDWKLAYKSSLQANFFYLFFGFCLTFFYPLLGTLRWLKVLHALDTSINYKTAFNSVMISFSSNIFFPAKSGDFIKVLTTKEISDKKKLVAAVITERIGDLIILSLLTILGGLFVHRYYESSLGFILFLFILSFVLFSKYLLKIIKLEWIKSTIKTFDIINYLFNNKRYFIIQSMLFSMLNWFIASLQVWLFFLASGADVHLILIFALFPITVLISLVPITPGSIGVREAAFLFLFHNYAEAHQCLASSLLYYICNTGITALIGVLFINSQPALNKKTAS